MSCLIGRISSLRRMMWGNPNNCIRQTKSPTSHWAFHINKENQKTSSHACLNRATVPDTSLNLSSPNNPILKLL
ncbi:hypothetical protein [Moraxella lacunata]|uniref:hypothetical protein n=1 Tax=Moraxella lacunata TaxID=477 RepID=UPI003EDF3880